MFRGTYYPSLDAKNRFFLPASFRDELGTDVVLFKSPDEDVKCLYLYTEERWEEVSEGFKNLPANRAGRALERKLMANVTSAEVDKSGRITINQQFREYAGMEKELVILGVSHRIEIWAKEEWLKEQEAFDDYSVEELNIQF